MDADPLLIKFSASFPVNIMQALFKNVTLAMLQYWSGTFFKDGRGALGSYLVPVTPFGGSKG